MDHVILQNTCFTVNAQNGGTKTNGSHADKAVDGDAEEESDDENEEDTGAAEAGAAGGGQSAYPPTHVAQKAKHVAPD